MAPSSSSPSSPRHILELSVAEQRRFIESFDLVISDCDGVVWLLAGWIPNVGNALNALRAIGKGIKFVSNNSFRTDAQYEEKFEHIGACDVNVDEDVVHPVKSIVRYLKKHRPNERVFSLMSLEANETLHKHGIDYEAIQIKEHLTSKTLAEHLMAIDRPVGAVLFDIHLDLSYVELAKAIRYLQQCESCELIAGGSDVIMPLAENLNVAGFYDFVQHVSRYTDRKPTFLGKPSPILGQMLKEMFEIRIPGRCLFVGDMLVQDVQFGRACGFQTLLVLSGSQTKDEMFQAPINSQPDYYADSLADFIHLLNNVNER